MSKLFARVLALTAALSGGKLPSLPSSTAPVNPKRLRRHEPKLSPISLDFLTSKEKEFKVFELHPKKKQADKQIRRFGLFLESLYEGYFKTQTVNLYPTTWRKAIESGIAYIRKANGLLEPVTAEILKDSKVFRDELFKAKKEIFDVKIFEEVLNRKGLFNIVSETRINPARRMKRNGVEVYLSTLIESLQPTNRKGIPLWGHLSEEEEKERISMLGVFTELLNLYNLGYVCYGTKPRKSKGIWKLRNTSSATQQ